MAVEGRGRVVDIKETEAAFNIFVIFDLAHHIVQCKVIIIFIQRVHTHRGWDWIVSIACPTTSVCPELLWETK